MSPALAEPTASPASREPMSLTTRFTYALIVGGFLLAMVSAYILVTNAQRLTSARQQLDDTNSQLARITAERDRVHAAARRMQSDMNLARAGTIYLIDTMESSQDFLADQGRRVRLLCNQTAAGNRTAQEPGVRSAGDGLNIGSRYNDGDFIRFCRVFWEQADWRRASNAIAMRRAIAASNDEYEAIAAEYQRLLPNARADPREAARMQEGLAYARLRLEQIDAARTAIREARRLAPDLALPAMTSLKIDCAGHDVDHARLRADLQDLRVRLDAKSARIRQILRRGANPAMERMLRYARVERRMVEQDPELYQRCAYAGLTPA